jgi:hypothetical protein
MWKISLLTLLVGFNVYADKIVDGMGGADQSGGKEQQDGEGYAVTPGNPAAGDNAVTGARNIPAACLSADTVGRYEKRARPAAEGISLIVRKQKAKNFALRNVRMALVNAGLVETKSSLGTSAVDAGPFLEREKFVNLMDCQQWRDNFAKKPNNVPLGAVLIYSGGKHGDARIKTASGCIGANENDTRCSDTGRTLTGVYVKVVN